MGLPQTPVYESIESLLMFGLPRQPGCAIHGLCLIALVGVGVICCWQQPTLSDISEVVDRKSHAHSLGGSSDLRMPSASRAASNAIIVQVDTRPLSTKFSDSEFHSKTAAINFLYAQRHGYEYVYFVLPPTFADSLGTFQNITASKIIPENWAQRRDAVCLHPTHYHARAAPWCKLLGWWWAVNEMERFSWVVGLDTDAFIAEHSTPVDRFVTDFLAGRPYWGATPGHGDLTLFRDPGRPDGTDVKETSSADAMCTSRYANTGFVLARAGRAAETLLRRWWNVRDHVLALSHPYEQDAFGALWRAGFGDNISVVCSEDRGFFRAEVPRQWVRHFTAGIKHTERVALINDAAERVGINSSTFFAELITKMHAVGAVRQLDQAKLVSDMQARTAHEEGGGIYYSPCHLNQCRDEDVTNPKFGTAPGLSRRHPPWIRTPQP